MKQIPNSFSCGVKELCLRTLFLVNQGPKLTFLCSREVVSRQMEKSGRQKVVRKIFASQRNTKTS